MNDHTHPQPEEEALNTRLHDLAGRVRVNPYFMDKLEQQLLEAHQPQKTQPIHWNALLLPALGWTALAAATFFVLGWFNHPQPPIQPAAPPSATAFTCPVTIPGGEKPASASAIPNFYGSPHLWTSVPFDGVYPVTAEDQDPDGSFSLKWGIWRKAGVKLDMSGTRLDTPAAPMRVFYTSGHDALGVQILALTFPTPGCWQVTAQAGDHSLTFVIELRLDESVPLTEPACPVTLPNGNTPPNETASEGYFGNGQLWTALWPNGIVTMTEDNRAADGSLSMKWPFWRGVAGTLEITGRQLDGTNGPVRADIPDGYGETGFQATGLIFPDEGCWEVTASIGNESLTFVTEVVYDDSTRFVDAPATATFAVQPEYPWRGTRLILKTTLPIQQTEAEVFAFVETADTSLDGFHRFMGDGLVTYATPSGYPSLGKFTIISPADALQKILIEGRPVGMFEMIYSSQGGGGGGRGFFKLNLNGPAMLMPTPIPAPQYLDGNLQYTVVVGDSLRSIASRYGVAPETIVQINNLPDNTLKPGTTITIPITASENPPIATIESVMLGYFMRAPDSDLWDPLEDAVLQPVWIFRGSYSDGNTFKIIIQALQEIHLKPAIATFESPG